MNRRSWIVQSIGLALAAWATSVRAQTFPLKPLTLVVPFEPGGNLDVVARTLAPAMERVLGRSVMVENRGGAGGTVGASYAARAKADGHTLLVTTPNAIVVLPHMIQTPYTLDSFQPVGLATITSLVVVVKANSQFKDIGSLLAHTRANPDRITAGHAGLGTTSHMALMQFEEAAKVKLTTVPYKGGAPALVGLIGGQTDIVVDQLSSSAPHIQSGTLRALAVMSRERDPTLPAVPTLRESGLADFDATTATGLLVPAGTPTAVVNILNAALLKALGEEAVRSRLLNVGSVAHPSSPQEFLSTLQQEDARALVLAKAGKLKAD